MPRQSSEVPLVTLNINFTSKIPLNKQLYNLLRNAILEGKFSKDQKLPGTRSLAKALKISRNTVDLVFDQLVDEGYIYKKKSSGSYVNEIPDNFFSSVHYIQERYTSLQKEDIILKNEITNFESLLQKERFGPVELISRFTGADEVIPFQNGIPSFNEFPLKIWHKKIDHILLTSFSSNLGYGEAAGYKPLRKAIASYLRTYRAVNCNFEQIIILNGIQQGLDVIGRLLINSSKQKPLVWIEDPGYFSARASFIFSGAEIFPCPLDDEGLDLNYAIKNNPKPDLIFTTPSHQFPLGLTMSTSRRLALLQYAKHNNCGIIEDDYDSEFRYTGNPLPSLQGMDKDNKVFYLGTFSKVLYPGLRVGYMVLPESKILETFAAAKSLIDRQNPILEQMVLAKFIEDGDFTKHLRKMRLLYKERQEFLIEKINQNFNGKIRTNLSPAGMHLIAWLPEDLNDKKIADLALQNNLIVRALSEYSIKYFKNPALLLGYAAFNKDEISEGINRLKCIFSKF